MYLKKMLSFSKEKHVSFELKSVGGILSERIFCFCEEKLLVMEKESIVCFEPNNVGGILGERTFCALKKSLVF